MCSFTGCLCQLYFIPKQKMQTTISFPDAGLPDVTISIVSTSLVIDAIEAAADEWQLDSDYIDIYYEGEVLTRNTTLVSVGLDANSQLIASLVEVFSKSWLTSKREKLLHLYNKRGDNSISLDALSLSEGGKLLMSEDLWLPPNIACLTLRNFSPVIKSIVCLINEPFLTSLDLSDLCSVTFIDDLFCNCLSLTSLNLNGLRNVTTIGCYFLFGCEQLIELDLSAFRGLEAIGQAFLLGCDSLTVCDLSPLSNVTSIGNDFLYGCRSIENINLKYLSSVTDVGSSFVCFCNVSLVERTNFLERHKKKAT